MCDSYYIAAARKRREPAMRAVGGTQSAEDGGVFVLRQCYFTASGIPAVTMPAIKRIVQKHFTKETT